MIYLFCGSDIEAVRSKAFSWVGATRKKAPEAPYTKLQGTDITTPALYEAVSAQGLFFQKTLTLIDNPFDTKETEEVLLEAITLLKETQNPVAIIAPKLSAAKQRKIEQVAEKVFVCDMKNKPQVRGFNAGLVTALASKNKELFWLELMKAKRLGDTPEMIHGLLHWKARDLMQKKTGKWTNSEARSLSILLIELLSDSRSGGRPLSENLERFALLLGE